MVKLAIFASGSGTNFENIITTMQNGKLKNAVCELLIVDKEHAYAIERAKKLNIPYLYVNPKAYANKEEYETEILKHLKDKGVQLIVLAGYMRFIGKVLLEAYPKRIINIHPAYLPNFQEHMEFVMPMRLKLASQVLRYIMLMKDRYGEIIHQEKLILILPGV